MGIQCNIERKGRIGRIVIGGVMDFAGAICIVIGLVTNRPVFFIPGIGLSIGGTFMILEGAIGWCAIRALGFKTKY